MKRNSICRQVGQVGNSANVDVRPEIVVDFQRPHSKHIVIQVVGEDGDVATMSISENSLRDLIHGMLYYLDNVICTECGHAVPKEKTRP